MESCWHRRRYLLNCWWVRTSPSSLMGKQTSQLATMFWILKSRKRAGKPSFCTTRAYFLAASRDCSSLDAKVSDHAGKGGRAAWPLAVGGGRTDLLAPVQTIFPELKISAVVLGSRILMMTAAKR